MERTLTFLRDSKVFYVATVDGNRARVRPFGIALNINGKLSICTGNHKDVFKQLKINPNIEISATIGGSWIRISGRAIQNTTPETTKKFFDAEPSLLDIYKERTLEVFSLEDTVVTFQSMGGNVETLKL
jgi:uncharacterized pyridoxamine 5'-phosphate oxidase family protein